jgi:hypothetical protein
MDGVEIRYYNNLLVKLGKTIGDMGLTLKVVN